MLSNSWTFLLIAAVVVAAVLAYEYEHEKNKTFDNLDLNAGHRIEGADRYVLYTGKDGKTCRDRVETFHKAGTKVGGFDYSTGPDAGCHIYSNKMGNDYTLIAEKSYMTYLPKGSKPKPSGEKGVIHPSHGRVMAP